MKTLFLRSRTSRQSPIHRSMCRFQHFDLGGVPRRQIGRAIEAQLVAWTPFPASNFAIALRGQKAMVYAWPEDLGPSLPESLYFAPPPSPAALRLLACANGFEGQYWNEGLVVASRWWPALPSDIDWQNFQRGAHVSGDLRQADRPVAIETTRLGKPALAVRTLEEIRAGSVAHEHMAVALLAFGLIVYGGWEARTRLALNDLLAATTQQQTELRDVTAPIEAARNEALANAAAAQSLAQTLDGPDPVEILAHIATLLQGQGAIVRELEIRRGEMTLALQVPDLNRRLDYLRALESGGWLQNIVEHRGQADLLNLKMNLAKGSPPPASPAEGPSGAAQSARTL